MLFRERELKPYAEHVLADELIEGSAYFSVTFVDKNMNIPKIETMVFIGKNLDNDENDCLYFQDVESYLEGVRYNTVTNYDYATFFTSNTDELKAIFEFEQALEELMRCSLRRNRAPTGT